MSEEHGDHFNLPKLLKILEQSPKAQIFTTTAVGEELAKQNIVHHVVEGAQTVDKDGFNITLTEGDHAIVYGISPCRVLTVSVGDFLYYPSDSFITTNENHRILALPTSGPWHKISESIDFANRVKSDYVIATHNSLLSESGHSVTNSITQANITDKNREWLFLSDGESKDFK